jgi:hypothetical protein
MTRQLWAPSVARAGVLALLSVSPGPERARSQVGRFNIKATRRQVAMTSSRWLKPQCSNVTMPWVGLDWLSRSDHFGFRPDRIAGED